MSQRNREQRGDEDEPYLELIIEIWNGNQATPGETFLNRFEVVSRMRTMALTLARLDDSIIINARKYTPASKNSGFIQDFNVQRDEHRNVAQALAELLFMRAPTETSAGRNASAVSILRRIHALESNLNELEARWAVASPQRRSKRLSSGEPKKEPRNEGPSPDDGPRSADV